MLHNNIQIPLLGSRGFYSCFAISFQATFRQSYRCSIFVTAECIETQLMQNEHSEKGGYLCRGVRKAFQYAFGNGQVILTLVCTGSSNKPLVPFCHSWLMLDPVQLGFGFSYPFSKPYWNPTICLVIRTVDYTHRRNIVLVKMFSRWFFAHKKLMIRLRTSKFGDVT